MSALFDTRPLKEAGSKAIEDAITRAITELAGEDYKADIKAIDFNPSDRAWMSDHVEIKLSLRKVKDWYTKNREFVDNTAEARENVEESPQATTATCRLCDASGFRFIKDSRYPEGAARKCSHDPEIEGQIPSNN